MSTTRAPMKSAIYTGRIRHRRFTPKTRVFNHRVTYFYIDLEEVPALFNRRFFFSSKSPSLFGFRRSAYLGPVELSLDEAVRRRVEKETGRRPSGPIRLLTQITYFGLSFNPVSFYYCFEKDGKTISHILAEITNTPWGERHTYVLTAQKSRTYEFEKVFHVSPFLGMDFRYRWKFSTPSEKVGVHMENRPNAALESVTFDATLGLDRRPLTARNLVFTLARQPFMTFTTLVLIYLHAAVIWMRRIPFVPHPKTLNPTLEGKTP
jgi:uncharacterized protein